MVSLEKTLNQFMQVNIVHMQVCTTYYLLRVYILCNSNEKKSYILVPNTEHSEYDLLEDVI